jgi:hypothetical protein
MMSSSVCSQRGLHQSTARHSSGHQRGDGAPLGEPLGSIAVPVEVGLDVPKGAAELSAADEPAVADVEEAPHEGAG